MSGKLKAAIGTVGIAAFVNFTAPGQAFAVWCAADASIIYGNIVGKFAPFLKNLIEITGKNTEVAVIQSGAATRAEILKAATANVAVEEGLETYRQEQSARIRALEMKAKMQQPANTCEAISASGGLSAGMQNAQARAFSTQARVASALSSNSNSVKLMDSAHKASNAKFCSPEEAALGVCKLNESEEFRDLAAADQDAAYLFQSPEGSSTYAGGENGAQSQAADGFIARVAAALPPEQLRDKGEAYYKRNPQARAYIELQRRYNAMLSMGTYSLSEIKEMHRPQTNLGLSTGMGFAKGLFALKKDMSMAEATERFAALASSPEAAVEIAKMSDELPLLRVLSNMSSFQLWLSYQQMAQSSRSEGLLAHQLVLLSEQTLRPQLDAQRAAAVEAQRKR